MQLNQPLSHPVPLTRKHLFLPLVGGGCRLGSAGRFFWAQWGSLSFLAARGSWADLEWPQLEQPSGGFGLPNLCPTPAGQPRQALTAKAEERDQKGNTSSPLRVCACVTFPHILLAKARPVDELRGRSIQADLRDTAGFVPDRCKKANITIK